MNVVSTPNSTRTVLRLLWQPLTTATFIARIDSSSIAILIAAFLIPHQRRSGVLAHMKRSTNFMESIIRLDKDNFAHMHGLELFLRYGPNFNEPFSWDSGTTLEDPCGAAKLSELQRPTILDRLFYFNRQLFEK
jgi:hypothetical protein